MKCDLCKNKLVVFLDLEEQPLANKYPTIDKFIEEKKYPLKICFCNKCKNVQLSYKISLTLRLASSTNSSVICGGVNTKPSFLSPFTYLINSE